MEKNEQEKKSVGSLDTNFPARNFSPALILPLKDNCLRRSVRSQILVILHAYHVDVAERMICRLASLNAKEGDLRLRLVVTTDTEGKARKIEALLAHWTSCPPKEYVIDVHPNRGRNVAPFLAACKAYGQNDDVILHLHTKKSPHAPELSGWGEYLFDCLAGSREVLESVLTLLENHKIGLLYPAHYRSIVDQIKWGPNLHSTQDMLKVLGVVIDSSTRLDFPSGMMFWTRLAALKPLLDMNLRPRDFEVEARQTDGTLAHAIERAMIFIVERSGHLSQSVLWDQRIDEYWCEGICVTSNQVPDLLDGSRLLGNQF